MAKITLMVGISGSGKSTKAKQIASETGALIINRDKLREMLFGYQENNINEYYSQPDLYLKENQVTSFQNYLVEKALVKNNDVIIDNTNLKLSHINEIVKKFSKYELDFMLIECNLQESINRDKARTRIVGEEVIRRQFNNLNILKKNFDFKPILPKNSKIFNDNSKHKAYIFDIDGTLALKGDRNPYDLSRVKEDKLNNCVAETLQALKIQGFDIIICSGRERTQECEDLTKEWLDLYNIEYDWILMRKEKDMRADYVIKEEMWREICKNYYIEAMFDDRNQVVNHARKLGFNVFQVNEGDF